MKKVFLGLTVCLAICIAGYNMGSNKYEPLPQHESVQSGDLENNDKASQKYEPTPTSVNEILQTPEPMSVPDNQNIGYAEAKVIVSGKEITFDSQGAVIKDGEVFVPVMGVFENLDGANENKDSPFTVKWDEGSATATIKNRWYTVIVTSEGQTFTCNGNQIEFTVPPQKINGTLMLPLLAIAEAMDVSTVWDDATSTISIFYESMTIGYYE